MGTAQGRGKPQSLLAGAQATLVLAYLGKGANYRKHVCYPELAAIANFGNSMKEKRKKSLAIKLLTPGPQTAKPKASEKCPKPCRAPKGIAMDRFIDCGRGNNDRAFSAGLR